MAKATILTALMDHLGLNTYRFEQEIKSSNGAIGKLMANDGEISDNLINKVRMRYPDVSEAWLRTGKRPMLVPPTPEKKKIQEMIRQINENITALKYQMAELEKML